MKNSLIVSGGNVDKKFFNNFFKNNKFDIVIASDKGLEVLDQLDSKPNYVIGDFDSINLNILNKYVEKEGIKIIKLNPKKDYTDTHMALKLAIELKSTNITIIGAIGTRMDHTIANISILKEALNNCIPCRLLNEKNDISLIDEDIKLIKDNKYKYISLIPFTNEVTGITLKGFKYNLDNSIIKKGQSIGVSNEQIENEALIQIKEGILILIKSID